MKETLTLPESTREAYVNAAAVTVNLADRLKTQNEAWCAQRDLNRSLSSTFRKAVDLAKTRNEIHIHDNSQTFHQMKSIDSHNPGSSDFVELCVDVIEQRKLLDPSNRELFDLKWG